MALSLADLRVTWDGKRVLNSIGLAYQVTDDLDYLGAPSPNQPYAQLAPIAPQPPTARPRLAHDRDIHAHAHLCGARTGPSDAIQRRTTSRRSWSAPPTTSAFCGAPTRLHAPTASTTSQQATRRPGTRPGQQTKARAGGEEKQNSQTGTRTRVAWVKATYPNRLDYLGAPSPNQPYAQLAPIAPQPPTARPRLAHDRDIHAHAHLCGARTGPSDAIQRRTTSRRSWSAPPTTSAFCGAPTRPHAPTASTTSQQATRRPGTRPGQQTKARAGGA
ncbi:hypothetical protein ON010_g12060 [Phytophthora cinnamomi]|nr:hypothetical protein ON010_g12060 [Phytophthora cinnamomi]